MADPVPTTPEAPAPVAPVEPEKTVLSDALPPGRVPVVRPDGSLTSVKAERYEAALQSGYKFQTPEQQQAFHDQLKYGERPVAAAAAGAGRGATLGLSDVALTGTGLVNKETLKGLEEQNPGASTAGEVAGAVAPTLIPGVGEVTGPGLAMKLGKVAEGAAGLTKATTVGGRLAAGVVRGAAEGSLFGAGSALSEAAFGDPDMTADKVLAHVGLGALLGAGGAGVGTAIEEGVAGLVPKLAKSLSGAQGGLDEFANDAAVNATRATQAEVNRIGEGNVHDIGKLIREGGHLRATPAEMTESLGAAHEQTASDVLKQLGLDVKLPAGADAETGRELLKRALNEQLGPKVSGALADIDASGAFPGGARPAFSKIFQDLDALEASAPNPAARKILSGPLEEARGFLREMGEQPISSKNGFESLNSLKTTLSKDLAYGAESTAKQEAKKAVVGVIKNAIDSQLEEQAGAGATEAFLKAKRDYGLVAHGLDEGLARQSHVGADAIVAIAKRAGLAAPEVRKLELLGAAKALAEKGAARSPGVGFKDLLAGVIGGGFHPGVGLVTAIGSKFMREYGPGVVAKLADRLAASPTLSTLSKSFGAQLPSLAPKLGDYAPILLNAAARSPQAALATHMTLAKVDPQYAATTQLAGLAPESPDGHVAALARAHRISEVGAASAAADKSIDRSVERLIKGAASPAGTKALKSQDFGNQRMRRDNEAAHEQRVNEYRALSDPDKLLERIAPNLDGVPPAIAAAMTARAAVAVQYITQAAAVPPKAGPLAHEWAPPEADMHDFALKLEAVERPLEALGHPGVTEEQVEAVKAVYPKLAQDVADKMLLRLAEAPEVPYSARLVLTLLTGVDVDGTFSPESIAANQSAIASAGGTAAPAGQGSPRKRAGSITLASRTAPRSERLEEQA